MPDDPQNTNNPDDNDLSIPSNPQVNDEENFDGSMPNPDIVDKEDTLEEAQNMGMYQTADEEHQPELDIAGEINKDEQDRQKNG